MKHKPRKEKSKHKYHKTKCKLGIVGKICQHCSVRCPYNH